MQFRQLEYFVAVARERHFARAAEACFVSQPSLSAAIAKLEDELGVSLINRGHSFEGLTPEGERLVLWARRILAEHDAFAAEVRAVRSGVSGTLRLGVGPTTSAAAALPIEAFCARHPLAKVQLVEHLTAREIHRRLREFELDAGIAYLSPGDEEGLDIMPLYEERYVAIASPELVPAEVSELSWVQLAQFPLALLGREMRVRQLIDETFAVAGATVDPQLETESIGTLETYTASGRWASVVPHTLLPGLSAPGRVRAIPLVDPEVRAQIVLATNAGAHEAVVTRAFRAVTAELELQALLDARAGAAQLADGRLT